MRSYERGTDAIVARVRAVAADVERCRSPRARLSDRVGQSLADLLVQALAGDHGMRRRRARD
jgi:hypothetical protein